MLQPAAVLAVMNAVNAPKDLELYNIHFYQRSIGNTREGEGVKTLDSGGDI